LKLHNFRSEKSNRKHHRQHLKGREEHSPEHLESSGTATSSDALELLKLLIEIPEANAELKQPPPKP
tara:strand:- start:3050 stop:3250 length:201 start_codon:yes stop_codon:yes gene_type:complete